MNRAGALRLFIALTPPPAVVGALAEIQARLRERLPAGAVRWTPPEQIHLTLRFLGDVPPGALIGLAEAVARAAAEHPGFELIAEGLGGFPSTRRPRVIWVGISGGLPALAELQDAVEAATAGWGKREERSFHAHLTLRRVRELPPARLREVSAALGASHMGRSSDWTVKTVDLFRSDLRPEGAVHTCLESFVVGR